MVRSCMTAVWDEVVECEVIKLGIQCNAMFYSLCPYTSHWCKALVLKRCSSFYQLNIHCVHYLEHRILPPLTYGFDALLTCSDLFLQ